MNNEPYKYQFEKLKRAQPIPSGGLKLIFAILTIVGTLIGSALAIYTALVNSDSNIGFLCFAFAFAYWLGLLIFALWTAFSFMRFEPTWPGAWLKRYWQNNVIGYDACVHLTKQGEYCAHVAKRGKEFSSRHCNNFTNDDRFFLRLNLGGWRNRTLNLFLDNHQGLIGLEYWQVTLKRLCFYHEDVTIFVRDGNNNTLTLEAKHLLNAVAHLHNKQRGLAGDIIIVLRHLLEYSERKHDQWQVEKAYAEQANEKLRLAEDTMRVTLEDLDNTRRFIKSKEAQEIREGLSARYDEIFPREPHNSQAA